MSDAVEGTIDSKGLYAEGFFSHASLLRVHTGNSNATATAPGHLKT